MTNRATALASQAQARTAGARFYAGVECPAHPDAVRYAANGRCTECAKAERRAASQSDDYRARDAARKRARREAASGMAATPAPHADQFADLLG